MHYFCCNNIIIAVSYKNFTQSATDPLSINEPKSTLCQASCSMEPW